MFRITVLFLMVASTKGKRTPPRENLDRSDVTEQRIQSVAGNKALKDACSLDVGGIFHAAKIDLAAKPESVAKVVPYLEAAKDTFRCSELLCQQMQIENLCLQ